MANIFSIIRTSLHDGPGIRTVLYIKGCPLRCRWCHNPEGLSAAPEILFYRERCAGCGRCAAACPNCFSIQNNRTSFERTHCTGCGKCAEACPDGALVLAGEEYTPEDAFNIIKKDKVYFDVSGGGVTFSGGECLLESAFVAKTIKLCKRADIHTAVETSLSVPFSAIQSTLETDLFIVDIKLIDSDLHKRFTGVGNELILENIRLLSQLHPHILIRVPLIPGVSDSEKNITDVARFIKETAGGIQKLELLKYNNLASSKYKALDLPVWFFADETQSDETVEQLINKAKEILPKSILVI